MRVYVGVDWSATEATISVVRAGQEPQKMKRAKRTFDSVRQVIEEIDHSFEATEIHVFIESGAHGWAALFHRAGAVVHVIDAKQAKRFAESWSSSGAKDDDRDASLLARMGAARCEVLEVWSPPSDFEREVEELARLHELLNKQCTAWKQRVRAQLRNTFPELEAVLSELRPWNLELIRLVPTPYHAMHLTRAEFDRALAGCGARKTTLERVWKVIEKIDDPMVSKMQADILAFGFDASTAQLLQSLQAVAEVEKRIESTLETSPRAALLREFGGVATLMAIRLLAGGLAGELSSDRDAAGVAFGACPVFKGSGLRADGKPKGVTIFRRSAKSENRATSYLLGRLASQNIGWAKARYLHDRERGKSAAQSYRAIARSLLRIMTAVLKTGEPYDDQRYVAGLKAKGVPWAATL